MAAYDFSSISTFTDVRGEIFGTIIKGFQSADFFDSRSDIITTTTFPVVSDTMFALESGVLPLSLDTGYTSFSACTLTPIDLGTVRGYGASDFNQYYGQFQKSGQLEQAIPFENYFV
jgi:hypothetical protein